MLVAIPCLYYLEVADAAEGAVEAELIRVAWDSECPIPDPKLIKPNMEGRIFSMHNFVADKTTPLYKVLLEAERKADDVEIIFDVHLFALIGEHEISVHARNRYEAEQLAIHQFFNFYEGAENLQVKVNSVRMN